MPDFETYLIRQRGFTNKAAQAYAANLRTVEDLIGSGSGGTDRERVFRRQARSTMSPDEISDCLSAIRAYADYHAPQSV